MKKVEMNVAGEAGTMPTYEELMAQVKAAEAENAAYKEKEARREEEKSLKAKIDAESRFTITRDKIVLHRIPNPEEIVSAREVFDYLALLDNKQSIKKMDRAYLSFKEFAIYQAIQAEGISDITYEMVEERMNNKKPENVSSDSGDNETNKTDNPSNSGDEGNKESTGSTGDGEPTKTAESVKPEVVKTDKV